MPRNPFDEIERMFDRMSHQFESLDEGILKGSVAIDVEDTDDSYVVAADLPGFEQEDLTVEYAGKTVSITASKDDSSEKMDEQSQYIRRERRQRSVSRSVRLPGDVDTEEAEAEYNNGVLTVTLPKVDRDSDGEDIPIN